MTGWKVVLLGVLGALVSVLASFWRPVPLTGHDKYMINQNY